MIPAWLLWSSVGMLAREVLPDSMFPKLGNKAPSPAPRSRQDGRPLAPPQVAGPRAAPPVPVVPAPPVAVEAAPDVGYQPMDPSLPMDEWIDPGTEQGVLAALEWEDDRQLDGFAQSISHEGDPFGYGYYPIAAGYLRYRAKMIREARQALATLEAEQAQKERIARGVVGANSARPHTAGDIVGTLAPTAQAPPPSLQAVPAVRVKVKRGKGDTNGATIPSPANATPTEPPPSLEGAE
jgi:hypothetical protein